MSTAMKILNPDIDIASHRAQLASEGLTSVPAFMTEDAARRAHQDISGPIPWELAITNEQGPVAISASELAQMTPADRHRLFAEIRSQARLGYSSMYYRQDLIPGDSPYFREMTEFIAGDAWLAFARELTGDEDLVRADLHATMYSEGNFLRTHDDTYSGKQRRYAFVIGLTKGWKPDWGGLFHLLDDHHQLVTTRVPQFNTLTIFAVPRDHCVSQVASFANERRYACTGWLFADK